MPKKKNPAAVQLGSKGGKARAKNLGAKGLSEANRKAVEARWERYRKSKQADVSQPKEEIP